MQFAMSSWQDDTEEGVYLGGGPPHPGYNVLDVVNILLLLSFRIGVIKAEYAFTFHMLRHTKAHKHGLHMVPCKGYSCARKQRYSRSHAVYRKGRQQGWTAAVLLHAQNAVA